jgi:hypothetical protein
VQSEAVLFRPSKAADQTSNGGTGHTKKGGKKKAASKSDSFEGLALDHSVLAMDYHKHIIAGLSCSKISSRLVASWGKWVNTYTSRLDSLASNFRLFLLLC